MKKFLTVGEIEAELLQYVPQQLDSGDMKLERIQALMMRLDNPQDKFRAVHIAGTSGKTSTAYYIRSLLESCGQTVGLTVSPHIQTVRERLQVFGGPLEEARYIELFNEFYGLVEGFTPQPTYFELLIAFAYWTFAALEVDCAVVETGLGGRLDATNTISRPDKVCVLTAIGLDHTAILGDTFSEIAAEKAGIIQEGNAVITFHQDTSVDTVFETAAINKQAHLQFIELENTASDLPEFQQRNFSLAYQVTQFVAERDGLMLPKESDQIIYSVQVPGRWEQYTVGDKTIFLDGAHNPQKLTALMSVLERKNIHPAAMVVAFSDAPETKIAECVELIQKYSSRSIYTEFVVQKDILRQSASLAMLRRHAGGDAEYSENPKEALMRALAGDEPYVVVTGSLYLVSVLLPLVQQMAQGK